MPSVGLQNAVALGQEQVSKVTRYIGAETYPLFKWVMAQKSDTRITDFGLRIAFQTAEDAGETFFTYADSSFRPYIPAEYDAMRVYPSRFAKTVQMTGEMLRELKAGSQRYFDSYEQTMKRSADAARKILSRHFHGDGTGTLSISTSTIGSTGVATMNGQYISGGTSAHTSTKGTSWLKKNEIYQTINPTTEAVRGVFTVLTEGRRSVSINVTSGTIAANDLIVQFGSYKKVPNGLRQLINFSNRILQNFNTANNPNLNTPYIDNGGNPISPAAFSAAKGIVEVYNNDAMEADGKLIVMTPGHNRTLVNQAFQYRQYTNPKSGDTVGGVASRYVDADGDIHFLDADAPDDQIRIIDRSVLKVATAMKWGLYDDDGMTWRMLYGTYNSGSDEWFQSIGWQGQLYKEGRALGDVVITNIAHTGADYATQSTV